MAGEEKVQVEKDLIEAEQNQNNNEKMIMEIKQETKNVKMTTNKSPKKSKPKFSEELLRMKATGKGMKINTESINQSNPNKIVFNDDDDNEDDVDDNVNNDDKVDIDKDLTSSKTAATNKRDINNNDDADDDDAVEEVKGGQAREQILQEMEIQNQLQVETQKQIRKQQKRKLKNEKQKQKLQQKEAVLQEEFGDDFFAKVDSAIQEQQTKKAKKEKQGNHTIFTFNSNDNDNNNNNQTSRVVNNGNIKVMVLPKKEQVMLQTAGQATNSQLQSDSVVYSRGALKVKKKQKNKLPTKKKPRIETKPDNWTRSSKLATMAFYRHGKKGARGSAALKFAITKKK